MGPQAPDAPGGMKSALWQFARDQRYALPRRLEQIAQGPGPKTAARICLRLNARGLGVTVGHFPGSGDSPDSITTANILMAVALQGRAGDAYLSVKAPQLSFDAERLHEIAQAAAASRLSLMFDAHSPELADKTLALFAELLDTYPGTGCVLPARWRRSQADAGRFRDSTARIRVVKGEWADEHEEMPDIAASYLALVERLAGRAGAVAIATHDPQLAERSLKMLLAAGTPCELEQLRGLPRQRTMAIARQLGVPVRLYVPFGRGWLPYALDKALARPYLLGWMIRDRLGLHDTAASPARARRAVLTGQP